MDGPSQDPANLFYTLYNPQTIFHFLRNALIIILGVLLLFGLAFMQFAFGAVVIVLMLAGFWQPANRLYSRMAGIHQVGGTTFQSMPAPGWFLTFLYVQVAIVSGLFVFSGFWLLFERGFLNQHLLFIFFK